MNSIVPITVLFEAEHQQALYNINTGEIEFVQRKQKELCNGFGNYAKVFGEKTFVAVFATKNQLYLLCDGKYELNDTDYSVELKTRFFKKDLVLLYRDGSLLFSAEVRIGAFDGDVIEFIYLLFKKNRDTGRTIKHLISFYQETDPIKRKCLDRN